MNRIYLNLSIVLIVLTGLWGCARSPGQSGLDVSTVLQNKVNQLSDEMARLNAKDQQLNEELVAARELSKQLKIEIQSLKKERDAINEVVRIRTQEREAVQNHYDQFRKSLRDLLAKNESTLPRFSPSPSEESPRESAMTGLSNLEWK